MIIHAIASGSTGNCYKISDGKTSLLIECGLPFPKIKEALNYQTSELDGCLISHEHADHATAAQDILRAGINVYTSKGTIEALGLSGHRLQPIRAMQVRRINTLEVMAFDLPHDAAEHLGFQITSIETGERLVYITDAMYCKYRFSRMTHLMIECNYDQESLQTNLDRQAIHHSLRNRIRKSHMSLEQVITFIQSNDLSRLQKVCLMHLSSSNSNEAKMKLEVQKITGVPVEVL